MAAIYSNGGNRWNILGFNFTKRDALSSVLKIAMICACCKSNMAPISSRSVALITALYHDKVMKQRRRQLRQKTLLLYLKERVFILRTFLLCLIFMTRSRAELARKPRIRSCRRLKRNSGWWENVWQNYASSRFKLTFRISRETFSPRANCANRRPGVSPGRGLLIPHGYLHPGKSEHSEV